MIQDASEKALALVADVDTTHFYLSTVYANCAFVKCDVAGPLSLKLAAHSRSRRTSADVTVPRPSVLVFPAPPSPALNAQATPSLEEALPSTSLVRSKLSRPSSASHGLLPSLTEKTVAPRSSMSNADVQLNRDTAISDPAKERLDLINKAIALDEGAPDHNPTARLHAAEHLFVLKHSPHRYQYIEPYELSFIFIYLNTNLPSQH